MRTACACIFTAMSIGLLYVIYQDMRPRVQQERNCVPQYRMPYRESAAEWAERVYGDLYQDSGVPEIDEALRAHKALRALPTHAWPREWIQRELDAHKQLDSYKYKQPKAPERLVGASERARPRWAGERGWREWDEPERRESVPAGEAVKRFVFGVENERL